MTFSGHVDHRPRNSSLSFGDVPDSGGTFDLLDGPLIYWRPVPSQFSSYLLQSATRGNSCFVFEGYLIISTVRFLLLLLSLSSFECGYTGSLDTIITSPRLHVNRWRHTWADEEESDHATKTR